MHQAEAIRAPYEGKSENMTAEEEARYDQFLNEADGLKAQIEREHKFNTVKAWSEEIPAKLQHGAPRHAANATDEVKRFEDLKCKAYSRYLKGITRQEDPVRYYENSNEYKTYIDALQKASPDVIGELKAYQADNPAGGGFMVVPQVMAGEILTLMKDLVFVRSLATIYEVQNAESLGIAAIDTDPSDSDWTSELATGSAETTLAFGKRELRPYPLAKQIQVSKKLLRQVVDADSVILDRLTYKMSIAQEKAFISGSGAQQPLGLTTAGSTGISTARDTTCASASTITGDEVISCFYSLKAQYRAKAAWLMYRTTVSAIRKLKDASNSYLWQPGLNGFVAQGTTLVGRQPETLMGCPIYESEYMPSITNSAYVAVVGDFSRYAIADALNMTIQVLYELYAATNQMGYILRSECDGMPLLEEAFARLQMHS